MAVLNAEDRAKRHANAVAWMCTRAMSHDRAVSLTARGGVKLEGVPTRARSFHPDYHLLITIGGREVDVFDVAEASLR